jgi:acetylornithine/succinyldiaminopimelate/putrescine aminotransferase
MMLFAKGIGSGFPIGGIACRDDLFSKMTPGMMVSPEPACFRAPQ